MRINVKLFFFFLFISGVGICAGAFFEVGLGTEIRETLSAALNSIFRGMSLSAADDYTDSEAAEAFISSFLPLVRSLMLPIILGFFSAGVVFLLPLIPIYILLKGISVGFSAAVLLESFGLKGIWYILFTLMPQNLIQLPVLCLLAVLSMQSANAVLAYIIPLGSARFRSASRESSSLRNAKKLLYAKMRFYIITYLLCSLLLCISCAIQAFLLPTVF